MEWEVGERFKREGIYVYLWLIHVDVWQKSTQFRKAITCVDHNKLWKMLQEMGIPYFLTCLLRNLYAGQEATVRTGYETTDWF